MPCLPPSSFSAREERGRREALAVHRDRIALFVLDLDVFRGVGRLLRRDRHLEHVVVRSAPRILEDAALVADTWRRFRSIEYGFSAVTGTGMPCLFGELDHLRARGELPLGIAPRRDHPDAGLERVVRELEPHLVVALAGRAVRDGVGAGRARDLDLALGDERPRDRRAEEIDALVERVRRGASGRRSRARTPRGGRR